MKLKLLPFGNFLTRALLASLSLIIMGGCATETSQVIIPQTVNSVGTTYTGVKTKVSVGKFDNRSSYMQGLFSDGVDRLGGQAKTILITHLSQSGRFSVLDRANLAESAAEAKYQGAALKVKGAQYVLTGQVTEFGRKIVGDRQLFGIAGSSKKQVAYAKVSLNVVNVLTSDVVYSVQGAGEYALSSREVIGFGGTAGYDSTLNGKVLDLAIREAVNRLVEGTENGVLN
jgi:curli biogenesis system outer membrane secretion channel CsgG